ncbi:hypothetical protein [Thermococcus thioreducens]|uniref:Uncharacterized protein n=1 Tax=Thermococcus thioreducens TaxID=277988 RepID=A0A1I0MD94_9EURY|nr:hypothetical protein [Thermococcus thioreducens]SEV85351.1 hypothetical protein SAMN05216170_0403 [Thermococcus thioreducens]
MNILITVSDASPPVVLMGTMQMSEKRPKTRLPNSLKTVLMGLVLLNVPLKRG